MSKIISIHSFRGGTGKSNTTANISAILAKQGKRVGVVDTDIQSPGIHILFGMAGTSIDHSLNDYLWGRCEISETAHDVTGTLGDDAIGKLYLIPSSVQADEIVNVLREGYDVSMLTKGFRELMQALNLDMLIIDTHPGLNEETLFSIAISHSLAIVMRPDQQDYEGTGVTVEVARSLGVPNMMLIVNKTPPTFDSDEIRAQVQQTYDCYVGAVLPHADEMMTLASSGIFVLHYPNHPLTEMYHYVAEQLFEQ